MKKEELQAGLEAAGLTKEVIGTVDIDKLNTIVNDDTNNVVKSKKDGFLEEGRNSFLIEKGFKTVDEFDAFKTKSESSDSEIQKKYTKLDGDFNKLTKTHNELNNSITSERQINQLKSTDDNGFKVIPEFAKFVQSEFVTAKKAAKESGKEITLEEWTPGYLEKNKQYQSKMSTGFRGSRSKVVKTSSDKDAYYDERYKDRHKK